MLIADDDDIIYEDSKFIAVGKYKDENGYQLIYLWSVDGETFYFSIPGCYDSVIDLRAFIVVYEKGNKHGINLGKNTAKLEIRKALSINET